MAVLAAILIGILLSVLIGALVGIPVVLLGLIVHDKILHILSCGIAADSVCTEYQLLSLVLKRNAATRPENAATEIPPAVAFNPPRKIPMNP